MVVIFMIREYSAHLAVTFFAIFMVLFIFSGASIEDLRRSAAATIFFGNGTCQVFSDTSTVTDRKVHLKMSGCAGVQRFQISESPDFKHPSKVSISVANVASDISSADVTVSYANGVVGAPAQAYSLPARRTLSTLAVLYEFADAEGKDHGVGPFETPTWLKRYIFGDGIIGWEGVQKNNSIRDQIYQSTAGRVELVGQTYPKIVHIPLEKFRAFLDGPVPSIKAEIIAAIQKEDPTYFSRYQFDYYFPLSSGYYAVDRGYHNQGDHVEHVIDWDRTTSIFANTIQEVRIAHDANRVVTRYNIGAVEGVWLATDTGRVGTNYYLGGSFPWFNGGADYNYIQLGKPLPTANTQVIVRYQANVAGSVNSSLPSAATDIGWGSHLLHENYHDLSTRPQMQFSSRNLIGDPYFTPALIPSYDVMENNSLTISHQTFGSVDGKPLLSAPNKYEMGYVNPLTLGYQKNIAPIHIVRSEFSDVSQVENNVTMIKVPLRKMGDPGLATKRRSVYYTELGLPTGNEDKFTNQYSGEEYLLIELRSKQPLSNGAFNFDQAMRSEGLVIYHMVETDSLAPSLHNGADIAENIDATPPYLGGYSNVIASPAAFGPGSNVYQINLQELWQEKPLTASTHEFDFLLSDGRGTKKLYMRFVDAAGNVMGSGSFDITLNSDETNRYPSMSNFVDQVGYYTGARRLTFNYVAPNVLKKVYYCWDAKPCADQGSVAQNTSGQITYNYSTLSEPAMNSVGAHTLRVELYDGANVKVSKTLNYLDGKPVAETTLSVPRNLTATVVSSTKVDLTWMAPSTGVATSYQVFRDGVLVGTSSTSQLYTDSTVQPSTSYGYTVKAVSGTTISIASLPVTVTTSSETTDPNTTLSAPLNVSALSAGSTSINLTWQAPLSGASQVSYYIIQRNNMVLASTTNLTYIDTAVSTDNVYVYALQAISTSGSVSPLSNTATVTFGESSNSPIAISAPRRLSAKALPKGGVSLTWQTPTSGSNAVAGYKLYRGGVLLQQIPSSQLSFSDASTITATTYTYYVAAIDSGGVQSPPSNTVTITPNIKGR